MHRNSLARKASILTLAMLLSTGVASTANADLVDCFVQPTPGEPIPETIEEVQKRIQGTHDEAEELAECVINERDTVGTDCTQLSRCCVLFAIDFICAEVAITADNFAECPIGTALLPPQVRECADVTISGTGTADLLAGTFLADGGFVRTFCDWGANEGGCEAPEETERAVVPVNECWDVEGTATTIVGSAVAHDNACV